MAGRFRRQQPSVLEIRGISRGSLLEHPRVEPVDEPLMIPPAAAGISFYDSFHPPLQLGSDDDDESTITGGSDGVRGSTQRSPSQTDETITQSETSHYWSAGNSFTTGNTTERSSVYSWSDDEFDHQASRLVRQMFQAIEKMLFEGVLSGSTSLQHECREWMSTFPHLRIIGKQMLSPREEGFQSVPTTSRTSETHPTKTNSMLGTPDSDSLEVKGSSLSTPVVPLEFLPPPEQEGSRASTLVEPGNDLSHLYEEIFEEDGIVEEYLAYDIREMDDDEHAKRYHVPRRRRLGFPPITPNACVRDAVLHQVFDALWSRIVGCLSGQGRSNQSLLKLLVQNLSRSYELKHVHSESTLHSMGGERKVMRGDIADNKHISNNGFNQFIQQPFFSDVNYDDDEDNQQIPLGGAPLYPTSSLMMPSLLPRLLYPDAIGPPPSRGSYPDQLGNSRYMPFSMQQGRLSVPHQNASNVNSLNDLMKISRKELQVRSERPPTSSDELMVGSLHDPRLNERPSSSYINEVNVAISNQPIGAMTHQFSAIGIGSTPSPFAPPSRPFTRDALPRQTSATTKKGRGGKLARLHPLDRAKTPNVDFNGYVKATKLVPGYMETPTTSFGGARVTSPPQTFHPPLTAPGLGTGGGPFWMNARLPPINSGLEALKENALLDFKKTRGKTAFTRISSALADEKPVHKGMDALSRPNTTHTFRADNLAQKQRATSMTPSNFMFGAQGNSIGVPALKSSSLQGGGFLANSGGSNMLHPQHSANSPDNAAGLVGITGRSINLGMSGLAQSASPDEEPGPPHPSWGPPSQTMNAGNVRRRRPVLGLI